MTDNLCRCYECGAFVLPPGVDLSSWPNVGQSAWHSSHFVAITVRDETLGQAVVTPALMCDRHTEVSRSMTERRVLGRRPSRVDRQNLE